MIWRNSNPGIETEAASVEQYISSELCKRCGEQLSPTEVSEVASAFAAYWRGELEGRPLTNDRLGLLLARALRGAGADQAAARVLACDELLIEHGDDLSRLGADSVGGASWKLFSSGLVRPARWACRGEETVWVLDLGKLQLGGDHCYELSFAQGLRSVLERLAPVWDGSEGQGTLWLRGARDTARMLWGRSAGPERIVEWCIEGLSRLGSARGWRRTPKTAVVDLPPRKKRSRR